MVVLTLSYRNKRIFSKYECIFYLKLYIRKESTVFAMSNSSFTIKKCGCVMLLKHLWLAGEFVCVILMIACNTVNRTFFNVIDIKKKWMIRKKIFSNNHNYQFITIWEWKLSSNITHHFNILERYKNRSLIGWTLKAVKVIYKLSTSLDLW